MVPMPQRISADAPDQLRGPQHSFAWGDEKAAWLYDDAWTQLQFGLRIEPSPGVMPQCIVTTTPRNTKAMKDLVKDPSTVVTERSTYESPRTFHRNSLKKLNGILVGLALDAKKSTGTLLMTLMGRCGNETG